MNLPHDPLSSHKDYLVRMDEAVKSHKGGNPRIYLMHSDNQYANMLMQKESSKSPVPGNGSKNTFSLDSILRDAPSAKVGTHRFLGDYVPVNSIYIGNRHSYAANSPKIPAYSIAHSLDAGLDAPRVGNYNILGAMMPNSIYLGKGNPSYAAVKPKDPGYSTMRSVSTSLDYLPQEYRVQH